MNLFVIPCYYLTWAVSSPTSDPGKAVLPASCLLAPASWLLLGYFVPPFAESWSLNRRSSQLIPQKLNNSKHGGGVMIRAAVLERIIICQWPYEPIIKSLQDIVTIVPDFVRETYPVNNRQ